jgi:hypothetical protein
LIAWLASSCASAARRGGRAAGRARRERDGDDEPPRRRGSFRRAVDLDFDVVVQVVRRVAVRVEADVAALRALRVDQPALGDLDVLLVGAGPSFDELS